jgi:hypothetical protein
MSSTFGTVRPETISSELNALCPKRMCKENEDVSAINIKHNVWRVRGAEV